VSVLLVRDEAFEARRRTAGRIFRGALIFNTALTIFWVAVLISGRHPFWGVLGHGLLAPWIGLAIAIAISTTALELFSPRGTDDFTMATGNALICLGFGIVVR
jgi:hypothetical protein